MANITKLAGKGVRIADKINGVAATYTIGSKNISSKAPK